MEETDDRDMSGRRASSRLSVVTTARSFTQDAESPAMKEESTPDEKLPGQLMKWVTNWIAFFWCLAAVLLFIFDLSRYVQVPAAPTPTDSRILASVWPPGAGFLHITSLSCNDTDILAGTDYA